MKNQAFQSGLAIISVIIVTLAALLFANSFVIINPGEAGVLSILGKARDGELLEGVHFKPPLISQIDIFDLTVQKFEVPAQSATKDLQDLNASFAINFRLDPSKVVEIRRTQGTLDNIVSKIIAPQTQEAFKTAAALRTAEQSITQRSELKQDFDTALRERLAKYNVLVLDTSVVNIRFSDDFAKAVEEKQVAEQRAQRAVYVAQEAEQEAQANINRAQGKAEAQRLLAETLKAQGGKLVLLKEAIEAWRDGGAQMPKVLILGKDSGQVPFIFNLKDLEKAPTIQ